MKIGLIREGKNPPDTRVALSPAQCVALCQQSGLEVVVEASPTRCYADAEYEALGIPVVADVSDCDVLMGIKEVPKSQLIDHKTYFFFSHTIKKQPHNRALLQEVLKKNITLIDYEVLTDAQGARLIAFGRFAGMVGAHNGLMAYGQRTGAFVLPRMHALPDYAAAKGIYAQVAWPDMKVVVTGTGRVANGAVEVLRDMGFREVAPTGFCDIKAAGPVFTQLAPEHYVAEKSTGGFSKTAFYADPSAYMSVFEPFAAAADVFINGIFYDTRAPRFFEAADMTKPEFKISVIADVSCDLMPDSSVPSTVVATTIAEPFYGYDVQAQAVCTPFSPTDHVTMMTVDNLPNELPRDASAFFGEQFIKRVLPEILRGGHSDVLQRATIAQNGALTSYFAYLQDYVAGE